MIRHPQHREHIVDRHDIGLSVFQRRRRDPVRLSESADPLDRGETSLAYDDLLPIQQLARMDEEMCRSSANTVPTRLAAKLWQARTDDSVGDNPGRTAVERSASTSKQVISNTGFGDRKPVSARVTRKAGLAGDRCHAGSLEASPRSEAPREEERPRVHRAAVGASAGADIPGETRGEE